MGLSNTQRNVLILVVGILVSLGIGFLIGWYGRKPIRCPKISKLALTSAQQWCIDNKFTSGVCMGGAFVVEGWMFDQPDMPSASGASSQLDWDMYLVQTYGFDVALRTLQNHWKNYITEPLIIDMATIGCTLIRIPVGYWMFEGPTNSSTDPYAFGQQSEGFITGGLTYLENLLALLWQHNMRVIIDLHAAGGGASKCLSYAGVNSQDPNIFWHGENNKISSCDGVGPYTSSRTTTKSWLDIGQDTMVTIATWINGINRSYGETFIVAFELLNEPALNFTSVNAGDVFNYFSRVVPAVQRVLSEDVAVMLNFIADNVGGSGTFVREKINDGSFRKNTMIDFHQYFNFDEQNDSSTYWLNKVSSVDCCQAYVTEYLDNNLPMVLGEWSTAASGDNPKLTFGGTSSDGMPGEQFLTKMYATQISNFYGLSRNRSFVGQTYWTARMGSGWQAKPSDAFPDGHQVAGTAYNASTTGFRFRSWNLTELVRNQLVVPMNEMGLRETTFFAC